MINDTLIIYYYGKNIKYLRLQRSLSQQDLADLVHSSKATICKIEKHTQKGINALLARRLAAYFGYTTEQLFDYDLEALSKGGN